MQAVREGHYIGGKWVASEGQNKIEVINPASEEVIARVAAGNADDIDKAVKAAREAFDREGEGSWSSTTGAERAKFLRAIAEKVTEKKEELARLESLNNGKPLKESKWDVGDVAGCFNYYATLAEELDKKQDTAIDVGDESFNTTLQYAPVGVAGAIIPWNYPLLMAAWKLAPALAAGCTIVLKPSELTPLTAMELTDIIDQVGLPAGVYNLVTGYGPEAGEPLSKHPLVDKVAFTGSVPTGCKVMSAACNDLKKVTLELGGKSPIVVFEDADVDNTVEWIMFGVFFNSGQVCSATSRLIIHEAIADKVLEKLSVEAKKLFVGDPFTETTPSMGPIVNETQFKKVLGYIEKGNAEGAQVLIGGESLRSETRKGFFIAPTVFTNVREDMTIWKEEIFGPVLSVMRFNDEREAIRLANDTTYGLAAAVMSRDKQKCERFARAFRAGIVWENCSQPTFVAAPWGGMKKSGMGRELGPWGLENYLEVKQVCRYLSDKPYGYYQTAN